MKVLPIYGWGWSCSGNFIDVPGPFDLALIEGTDEKTALKMHEGIVTTQDHLLTDMFVQLSARSKPPTSDNYNLIADTTKTWHGLTKEAPPLNSIVGFASINPIAS